MNVNITKFSNPFSFFCIKSDDECLNVLESNVDDQNNFHRYHKSDISNYYHGQYVAVLRENKWNRGVISMETQFLIWLVDLGFYLRPDDKTIFIPLPAQHKTHPTKIFEASIHGVTPIDKTMTEFLQIINQTSTMWTSGAVEKSQTLIKSASRTIFVPIALMSTKYNDIVLGDLYLHLPNKGLVNLVDELELWPVFLERKIETYIENLPIYYNTHRKHRACTLKPEFDDFKIPAITLGISLEEYNDICENALVLEDRLNSSSTSIDSSTSSEDDNKKQKHHLHKWTANEIDEYAHMFVTICGRKYNVLHLLLNKLADLHMCKKYRDHDLKSVGRANHRLNRRNTDRDINDIIYDLM